MLSHIPKKCHTRMWVPLPCSLSVWAPLIYWIAKGASRQVGAFNKFGLEQKDKCSLEVVVRCEFKVLKLQSLCKQSEHTFRTISSTY